MSEYFYLMFGFLFALRILKTQSRKVFLGKRAVTIIGTGVFFWIFLFVWRDYTIASHALFPAVVPAFVVFLGIEIYKIHYFKNLDEEILRYVQFCCLELNMGHSFQQSMKSAKAQVGAKYLKMFEVFLENVSFSQHNSIEIGVFPRQFYEFISNFSRIFNHKGSQIVATKSYLECLKTKRLIRHKSGQLSFQSKLQAIVLGIFYAVCLVYMLRFHYSDELKTTFISSLVLFILGQLWIWKKGDSYKWKV